MIKIALAALAAVIVLDILPAVPVSASVAGLSAYDGAAMIVEKRRKERVKGGSGCDDPDDVIEHPECR
jgi:hypothetical protein